MWAASAAECKPIVDTDPNRLDITTTLAWICAVAGSYDNGRHHDCSSARMRLCGKLTGLALQTVPADALRLGIACANRGLTPIREKKIYH